MANTYMITKMATGTEEKCVATTVNINGHNVVMVFKESDNREVTKEIKEILLRCCENCEGGVENDRKAVV